MSKIDRIWLGSLRGYTKNQLRTNQKEKEIKYSYAYAIALLTAPNRFSELVH